MQQFQETRERQQERHIRISSDRIRDKICVGKSQSEINFTYVFRWYTSSLIRPFLEFTLKYKPKDLLISLSFHINNIWYSSISFIPDVYAVCPAVSYHGIVKLRESALAEQMHKENTDIRFVFVLIVNKACRAG